jgi:tellurite resistance protein
MFPLMRTRSHRRRTRFVVVERPTPETIAGLATAGAIMACADGRLDAGERHAWLGFLREHGVLTYASRREMLACFDQRAGEFQPLSLPELCEAAGSLSSLAGTSGAQPVGMAASRVALADGIVWPQEVAMLQVIRAKLGLSVRQGRDAG